MGLDLSRRDMLKTGISALFITPFYVNTQTFNIDELMETAKKTARVSFDGIFAGFEFRECDLDKKHTKIISTYVDLNKTLVRINHKKYLEESLKKLESQFVEELMKINRVEIFYSLIYVYRKERVLYLPNGKVYINCKATDVRHMIRVHLQLLLGNESRVYV